MVKRTRSDLAGMAPSGELIQAAALRAEAEARARDDGSESQGRMIELPPAPEDDEIDPVENVRAQLNAGGDGSFVTVMRVGVNGKPDTSCGRMDAQTFDIENVRAEFGPGTYRFIGYAPRPNGPVSRFANKVLTLEASRVERTAVAPANTQSQQSEILALANAMQQGFARLGELIAAAAKQPSRAEMLEEMRIMRDMFAASVPAAAAPTVTDQLSALESVMSLAERFAEKTGGGDSDGLSGIVNTLIKEIAPALVPLITERMAQQPAGTPALAAPIVVPGAAPPASAAKPAKPITVNGEETDVNLLIQKALTMQLRDLVEAAARNADTDLYAELILDRLPPASVIAFLSEPQWFAKVCELDARVAQHQEWFTRLSASVQSQLTDTGESDQHTA